VQRGQLFRTPISQHARVAYLRDMLDWAYARDRSDEWLEGTFWDCFLRAVHDEMQVTLRRKKSGLRRFTAGWPWQSMQEWFRDGFERAIENRQPPPAIAAGKVARRMKIWTGPDGRRYWHYVTLADLPIVAEDTVAAALDEALCDLRGLAVEALGRCEQCNRYFVRVRAERKRFCSPRCLWQASKAGRHRARGQRRRRVVPAVK
jgi:hypothetical protein